MRSRHSRVAVHVNKRPNPPGSARSTASVTVKPCQRPSVVPIRSRDRSAADAIGDAGERRENAEDHTQHAEDQWSEPQQTAARRARQVPASPASKRCDACDEACRAEAHARGDGERRGEHAPQIPESEDP